MQDDNIGVLCLDFVELFSDVYSVNSAQLYCSRHKSHTVSGLTKR